MKECSQAQEFDLHGETVKMTQIGTESHPDGFCFERQCRPVGIPNRQFCYKHYILVLKALYSGKKKNWRGSILTAGLHDRDQPCMHLIPSADVSTGFRRAGIVSSPWARFSLEMGTQSPCSMPGKSYQPELIVITHFPAKSWTTS